MNNNKTFLMAIPVVAIVGLVAYSLGGKSNTDNISVADNKLADAPEPTKPENAQLTDYAALGLFDPKECLRGGTHDFETTEAKDKDIKEELRGHPYGVTLYSMFQLVNAVEKLKAVKIDNKFCVCDTPFVPRTELFSAKDKEHIESLTFKDQIKKTKPIHDQLLIVNGELSKLCSFEAQHGNNTTK
ncbi:MAG TPA: hypothetical protein DCE52_04905 [Rhodobacteraceae bacterium]|nr:hypothetical protein [Paracoccaceae bacterium]